MDVYIADNKIASSGAMWLDDLDLQRAYRAIDGVATGRTPLFSGNRNNKYLMETVRVLSDTANASKI